MDSCETKTNQVDYEDTGPHNSVRHSTLGPCRSESRKKEVPHQDMAVKVTGSRSHQ